MEAVLIAAVLRGTTFSQDGSMVLRFDTQEPTPEQKAQLGRIGGEFLYLAIKKESFTQSEQDRLTELKAVAPVKSQAKKLRSMLWKLWRKNSEGFDSAEEHYNYYMQQFHKQVAQLLDE